MTLSKKKGTGIASPEPSPNAPSLSIRFPRETGDITIDDLDVTQMSRDLYRIEEDIGSLMIARTKKDLEMMPRFGDIIRASSIEKAMVEFIAIHERARMKRYEFILREAVFESHRFSLLLRKVAVNGGYVERQSGGLLLIFIPDQSNYDPTEEIIEFYTEI